MEKVKSLLKPKPNPQQQLRDWQRRLRQECRNIERQIRDVEKEEKSVQKAIREAAKRNDMGSAKSLAKEIVRSRRTVNRLHENKAQMNSISMHLGESVAIARTVGHLSKSAEVMKLVNNLMKAPQIAATMQEFSKEMTKAGVIEEMVNDAVDSALDSEDIEEETEEEVDKVLTELAGETAAQLPEAVRREKQKQPAQAARAAQEEEPIAEGDDEEELEEIRARLAKVLAGCSSELALFYENGPFTIADNMSLVWNQYGWDQASNLIYVDQPTGTGFSYSSDARDLRHNELGVSNDLYNFLQAFFAEHPQYAKNDFYITGESYAGHYIPAFASRVHQGNKAKEGIHINLKGFAIGNGLTDPAIQYKAYTDYALDMGIKESDYKRINKIIPACEMSLKLCGTDGKLTCMASYLICSSILSGIMRVAGDMNHYDIRKKCVGKLCYDFSNLDKFLNQRPVRDALGVGKIDFVSCSPTVYAAMLMDWMRNLEVGIPTLLEDGIKMLIYAGEYDLICNWLGNSRWVDAMEWSGQQEYVGSPNVPFVVDGAEAGQLKSYGPLSFLKVHDAGHMVPMDQPKAALEMLKRWTGGKLAEDVTEPEELSAAM